MKAKQYGIIASCVLLLVGTIPVLAQGNDATVQIINELQDSICHVYISTSEADWGRNRLEGSIIPPGATFTLSLSSGMYDFRLGDCNQTTLLDTYQLDISGTYQLVVQPSVVDCFRGVALALADLHSEAVPLLETGFAGHQNATFPQPKDLGNCAFTLGLFRDNAGDLGAAIEAYEVALEAFRQGGNQSLEVMTLNNIGLAHKTLGQHEKAWSYYREALALARELHDDAEEDKALNNLRQLGIAFNNSALTYHQQGHYEQALAGYQHTLSIMQAIADRKGEGIALNNIAPVIHLWYGDVLGQIFLPDLADIAYQQVIRNAQALGDLETQATGNARLWCSTGDKKYYQEAERLYQELGDRKQFKALPEDPTDC